MKLKINNFHMWGKTISCKHLESGNNNLQVKKVITLWKHLHFSTFFNPYVGKKLIGCESVEFNVRSLFLDTYFVSCSLYFHYQTTYLLFYCVFCLLWSSFNFIFHSTWKVPWRLNFPVEESIKSHFCLWKWFSGTLLPSSGHQRKHHHIEKQWHTL